MAKEKTARPKASSKPTTAKTPAAPATPQPKKKHWLRWCLSGCGVLVVILILMAVGGGIYQNYISSDEYFLEHYTPRAEIEELVTETKMTQKGKVLFYRTNPEFIDPKTMKEKCGVQLEFVMGCYTGPDQENSHGRIYLLNMVNTELVDHKYATAAHEMLHTVYTFMTEDERKKINKLIEDELPKAKQTEPKIQETIDKYTKAGLDIPGEMHSRLGTEFKTLSGELETHYAKYFDQDVVFEWNEKSEAVFESRIAKIDAALADLKAREAELDRLAAEWQATYNRLIDLYNRRRYSEYNRLLNTYNAQVANYNAKAEQYNAKVDEYRALIADLDDLYRLINPDYERPETAEKKS